MPLQKISVTIPLELVTQADELATTENSNRSKVVANALQSYLVGQGRTIDNTESDNGRTVVGQDRIVALEREIVHKDELIRAKDETIQQMRADAERYAQAREDEIKRYENIAGYYGTESSKIIDRLAGISESLSKLLPSGTVKHADASQEPEPKQGFWSRLLGR